MSLRTFHLLFILLLIIGAEMFGAREIWAFSESREPVTLLLGILSLLGGLGLAFYALVFVRRMDAASIR
jgi:hypothetical protein